MTVVGAGRTVVGVGMTIVDVEITVRKLCALCGSAVNLFKCRALLCHPCFRRDNNFVHFIQKKKAGEFPAFLNSV
jgi:hypothetical protein